MEKTKRRPITPEMDAQLKACAADVNKRINDLPMELRLTFAQAMAVELHAAMMRAQGPDMAIGFLHAGILAIRQAKAEAQKAMRAEQMNPASTGRSH